MTNSSGENAKEPMTEVAETRIKLRLSHPHPLISRTTYKSDPRNHIGHSLPNDYEGVDVRVSRGQFRTALAVMDRLFKALEKRDLCIRIGSEHNNRGTYVYSGNYDKCQVYIDEEHRRVEHQLTAKEKADKARYSFLTSPKWDFIPTGRLVLHPGGDVDLSSQQALDALIDHAVSEIVKTIEKERERRKQQEDEHRIEMDRQQRVHEEKGRTEAFYKSAEALRRYHILMEYIEEVRRFGCVPLDQLHDGQTLEEWFEWAKAKARAVHPLGH